MRSLGTRLSNFIYYLLIGLTAGGIFLFCLYPILKILGVGFMYEGIFKEAYPLMKNTLFTSVISALGATFISVLLAFYIMFSPTWRGKWLHNFLLMTMIAPPFVFGLSFITLFGRRGLITYRLLGLKLNPYGWHGIVLLQIMGEISFGAFILVESLKGIDGRLITASKSLGASSWETIKRIVLPFSISGIAGIFFLLFTKNIADFGTPIIMGGNYTTLATEAYLAVVGNGDFAKASAMSILLIFPALLAFLFYRWSQRKNSSFSGDSKGSIDLGFTLELPILLRLILGGTALLFTGIMALQYGSIFISGFSNYTTKGLKFTLEYLELFRLGKYKTFIRSILYALIAGFFSAGIGVLLSYYTERRRIKGMRWMEFIASLPYIIPGTFFGLGYILAFNRAPFVLTGTSAIVVLNCIYRQISIGSKAGNALFSRMDRNLERAAQDLGASKGRILWDIVLPTVKPALTAAFINGFTTTMTTTGAIIFLVSPGASVATIEMFNTIRDGDYGLASIIALAIIVVTFGVNILSLRSMERGGYER